MQINYAEIKALINSGEIEKAQIVLSEFLVKFPQNSTLLYYQGNLFRKTGNWQQALSFYMRSELLDVHGPASQARLILEDIMNFYNKDMYNQ